VIGHGYEDGKDRVTQTHFTSTNPYDVRANTNGDFTGGGEKHNMTSITCHISMSLDGLGARA
jgi:hypothetical protein